MSSFVTLFDFSQNSKIVCNGEIHEFSYDILSTLNFQEIFVVISPGSYMGIRRSLAIVYAIEIFTGKRAVGVDILDYLNLFDQKVAYINGNHIWYRLESGITHVNSLSTSHFKGGTTNLFWKESKIVDCTSISIFNHLRNLPHRDPVQLFFDKFSCL